jgi:hypothetical protein
MRRFILGLNKSLQLSLSFPLVKKHLLVSQNGPEILGLEKLLKIVNCQQIVLRQLE